MLKIFDRESKKDRLVSEPTRSKTRKLHEQNLAFALPNASSAFGIEFSYELKKAGPFPMEVQVTTPEYAGVVRVQWQPTQGGWDTHLLDILFGQGNGQKVFESIAQ
jgi:hypothetical protein